MFKAVLLFPIILLLSGCSVNDVEWKRAVDKCASFGGVDDYVVSFFSDQDLVRCKDGTRIYVPNRYKNTK